MSEQALWEQADNELSGVGAKELGEWWQFTGRAGHLRRRLSEAEAESIGPVVDIRGTGEAVHRLSQVLQFVPSHLRGPLMMEARRP